VDSREKVAQPSLSFRGILAVYQEFWKWELAITQVPLAYPNPGASEFWTAARTNRNRFSHVANVAVPETFGQIWQRSTPIGVVWF
jgi:hypothetical protein